MDEIERFEGILKEYGIALPPAQLPLLHDALQKFYVDKARRLIGSMEAQLREGIVLNTDTGTIVGATALQRAQTGIFIKEMRDENP
jgi:hypothetical protein